MSNSEIPEDANITTAPEPLFVDLKDSEEATEIGSLCMRCHEMGVTKMLMTTIPFFGNIVIMAFECDCGFRNSETIPGGSIEDKGVRIELKNVTPEDLNRQVVKGKNASIIIPDLDFEVPAETGKLTTIEGILEEAIYGLNYDQPVRRQIQAEEAKKIDLFIEKLIDFRTGKKSFTFVMDDPSGNSHIENPFAPNVDQYCTFTHYIRTEKQTMSVGLQPISQEAKKKWQTSCK